MNKIKILIADDHSLFRMGLSSLIASQPDLESVGEADNGQSAVEQVRKLKPDVVIMDLMMPDLTGAEATKLIHDEFPEVKVVILTTFGTSAEMSQAIANGAVGALMKDTKTIELLKAIRAVAANETVISPRLRQMAKDDVSALKLTDHQREILSGVVRGLRNSDIARELGVSEITVKKALQTIFAKIGASSRTEAAAIATRKHLVKG